MKIRQFFLVTVIIGMQIQSGLLGMEDPSLPKRLGSVFEMCEKQFFLGDDLDGEFDGVETAPSEFQDVPFTALLGHSRRIPSRNSNESDNNTSDNSAFLDRSTLSVATTAESIESISVVTTADEAEFSKLKAVQHKMRHISMLLHTGYIPENKNTHRSYASKQDTPILSLKELDQDCLGICNPKVSNFIIHDLYAFRIALDGLSLQEIESVDAWQLNKKLSDLFCQWSLLHHEVVQETEKCAIINFVERNLEQARTSMQKMFLLRSDDLLSQNPDETIKQYYDQYYALSRKIAARTESAANLDLELRALNANNPCKAGKYPEFKDMIHADYGDHYVAIKTSYRQEQYLYQGDEDVADNKKFMRTFFSNVENLSQDLLCQETLDVQDVMARYQRIIYNYCRRIKEIHFYDSMAASSILSIECMMDANIVQGENRPIFVRARKQIKNFFATMADHNIQFYKARDRNFYEYDFKLLKAEQKKLFGACCTLRDNPLFDNKYAAKLYNDFSERIDYVFRDPESNIHYRPAASDSISK